MNRLAGLSPFLGDSDNETQANVIAGEYTLDVEEFEQISKAAKDFIGKLLVKKKENRLPAEKCLEHEWLKEAVIGAAGDTSGGVGGDVTDGPRRTSLTAIDTSKHRAYWARRKWKKACGAVRAVQRITLSLSNSKLAGSASPATAKKSISGEQQQQQQLPSASST